MTGAFIDRDDALRLFHELLAQDSDMRILVVWGVAGQGKSTLLRHLSSREPQRCRLVDLDQSIGRRGGDADAVAGAFVEAVFDAFAGALLSWTPWWSRSWRRLRYHRSVLQARQQLVPSTQISIVQRASSGGAQDNVSASVVAPGHDAVIAQVHYRRALSAALADLARGVGARRRILMVDTSEWLGFLDTVARPSRPGSERRGGWEWGTGSRTRSCHA